MFYDFLTPQEKAALASAWPAPRLLETTSPQTTLGDGNHLISIGDRASFQDLAKRSYTAVSREPLILYKWGWKLTAARRYAETLSLIDQFDFVKKENAGIWRLQLDTLDRRRRAGGFPAQQRPAVAACGMGPDQMCLR